MTRKIQLAYHCAVSLCNNRNYLCIMFMQYDIHFYSLLLSFKIFTCEIFSYSAHIHVPEHTRARTYTSLSRYEDNYPVKCRAPILMSISEPRSATVLRGYSQKHNEKCHKRLAGSMRARAARSPVLHPHAD